MSLELCTHLCRLLTLLEKYAAQGLCNGPVSVRLSVRLSACLSLDRKQQRRAAGLLLSALRASRTGYRSIAAGAEGQQQMRAAPAWEPINEA